MSDKQTPDTTRNRELDLVYGQLAQNAARLMVVHEASNILRSSHNAEELASGLLDVIGEAVFAVSGCVASLKGDELKILAVRGLAEHEADTLASDAGEAGVWFAVADGDNPRTRAELLDELDFSDFTAEVAEDEEKDPEEAGDAALAADNPDVDDEGGDDDVDEAFDYEALWAESEATLADGEEEGEEDNAEDETDEDEDPNAEPASSPHDIRETAPYFDLYLPLRVEDEVLGVLALGPRVDRRELGAEDVQLASSLSSHLALALNHAALFEERNRRIEQLGVLLQISREITSTLDMERVLTTIAQMIGLILPNRRAVVGLDTGGGKVAIRASSDPNFKSAKPATDPLLPVLSWAMAAGMLINTHTESLETDEEAEGRDVLLPVLSAPGGPKGIALLPLKDDQGTLGVMAIETDEDAPPLDDSIEELVSILANQTTVAIRNAELYQQIPMISMLEPIMSRARKAGANRRKLLIRAGVAAAVLLVGFLVPLPAWVSGDATVKPALPVALRAATEGTVDEVLVHEGEQLAAGTVVARMRRDGIEMELEQAKAAAQRARVEAARARSRGDLAEYRSRQATLNELFQAALFLEEELKRTELITPVAGVVLTPNVQLRRGVHLSRGETFAELANLSSLEMEVTVAGRSVDELETGRKARLKVHAFPSKTFPGTVRRIAPQADAHGDFRVVVAVDNGEKLLRPGMTGRAHLELSPRPVLKTLLGPLARGFRLKYWF